MRAAVLVTGGKDSALALYRVIDQGFNVVTLLTMLPQRADSWMFHYPNIHMAEMFAEAAGISHRKAATSGQKNLELLDLKQALAPLPIDAVVSGAISSRYQKENVDKICQELNLKHVAPLWHEDPLKLLNEIVKLKMETIVVGVYAHGFTRDWLGRKIDPNAIRELVDLNVKYQVSLVGEGGEYETLVLDAPFFNKKIQLVEAETTWQGESGTLLIKKAVLANKEKRK